MDWGFGLKQERRSLRTRVLDLSWTLEPRRSGIGFLAKGSYATAMLRSVWITVLQRPDQLWAFSLSKT